MDREVQRIALGVLARMPERVELAIQAACFEEVAERRKKAQKANLRALGKKWRCNTGLHISRAQSQASKARKLATEACKLPKMG